MSTRSFIGILNENQTVDFIYCHFDGYLEHNGKILKEHWNTEGKIRELLKLGDLQSLGTEIGEKHDGNARASYEQKEKTKNWCCAYGRDIDKYENNNLTLHDNVEIAEYKWKKDESISFVYLFSPMVSEWLVCSFNTGGEFKNF